ncbi:unnamed protein product [Rhizoctonia solani]|uniref:G domain-containing protein n=1 Tax=Rhizoctonia solani TaxID=456999 RepID=A0A8H2XRR1_9AGAM|nr:unnamed protein product [Rhizoctonia solani]
MELESMKSSYQSSIYLLVLGRSGSGKSYHIDNAFCKKRSKTHYSYPKTTIAVSKPVFISGHKFRFIDTPGFDNPRMSDAEALAEIGDYFLHPGREGLRISGILYIHQAGDAVQSRALARVFAVLSAAFFDSVGLSRLTILVACDNLRAADPTAIEELHHPSSVFSIFTREGARIEGFNPERNGFQEVLKAAYLSKRPISLPIQQFPRMSRPEFVSHMEDLLGCYEIDALQSRLASQEKRLNDSFDAQMQTLNSDLQEKDDQLGRYHTTRQQNGDRLATQDKIIAILNQKLLQSHQEYSSLRSQLQLQENVEQSELVQELQDLNRRIDDIGRSFSEYLTDKYVLAVFGKDLGETTALDARNLSELKLLLGHVDGKPSLIASAKGEGMDVEGFLDFSIRSLLCAMLFGRVFWPFHPSIPLDQSKMLHQVYKDIRGREPQAVAGKWRSNTFKSIYIPPSADATETTIGEIITDFLNTRLNRLIVHFFGQIDNPLEPHHLDRLRELIKVAWEWNTKLKGDVIMLGDFRLVAYRAGFHPAYMEEFESDATKPQAKYVLGTLALALISQRAVGRGQPPEETVVCKALVATENLYA